MPGDICLIMTTVDNEDTARHIARSLVAQHLAACVQMLPNMRACYRWQGKVEEAGEIQIQIKTAPDRAGEVVRWLTQHHPYDLPEIVRLDAQASDTYAAWVASAVAEPNPEP